MILHYRVFTGPCWVKQVAEAFTHVPGVVKVLDGTEHVYVDIDDDILYGTDIERVVKSVPAAKAAHAYCSCNQLRTRWMGWR